MLKYQPLCRKTEAKNTKKSYWLTSIFEDQLPHIGRGGATSRKVAGSISDGVIEF